jgi:hypothetical protein
VGGCNPISIGQTWLYAMSLWFRITTQQLKSTRRCGCAGNLTVRPPAASVEIGYEHDVARDGAPCHIEYLAVG